MSNLITVPDFGVPGTWEEAIALYSLPNDQSLTIGHAEQSYPISFMAGGSTEPILVLDKAGMTYMGKRIEDAGEAHKAWMETMRKMQDR